MNKTKIILVLIFVFTFVGLVIVYREDLADLYQKKKAVYIKIGYDVNKQDPLILRKYDNEFFKLEILNQTNTLISDHEANSYNIISKDSLLNLLYSNEHSELPGSRFNLFVISQVKRYQNRIISVKPVLVLED